MKRRPKLAEAKTKLNDGSVEGFLASIEPEGKHQDSFELLEIFKEVTGEKAEMWGDSMVGFGKYTQTYADGSKRNWSATGFSPRKQSLTVYIMNGFKDYDDLLAMLGKHSHSKVCIYIKKLEQIDQSVLREIIKRSVTHMAKHFPVDPSVGD